MKINEQQNKAKKFVEYWKDKGYEKGESQKFWLQLLSEVLEVENATEYIEFEEQVHIDKHAGFIDGYIKTTKVLIEQKSKEKDLRKGIRQADGTLLTPFQQAKKYIVELPVDKHPKWVITCNFKSFLIYNMNNPNGEPEEILLEDLPKEYYRLQFIANKENENLKKEMEVSIQAGEIVGILYDKILPLYINPQKEETLKSLNMLCVRLVFCLYAEDSGIFGRHNMFHDYLSRFEARDLREAILKLFKVLDTKAEDRDPYMQKDLAEFPYVNGGLFADENIEIPQLTEEIKEILLSKASEDFDWSDISPTIFGAVFESTLNPETRRKGGMHYTSIENIHKVIDPLFLNELKEELEEIKNIEIMNTRKKKLKEYQNKLSKLTFLDPACGSGNFLTETYISIRKLENEVIENLNKGQIAFGDEKISPIQVTIEQFYGIEINDFAVTVAKTALWIAESQMMKKTEEILHINLEFLPLKSYANIIEGNALRIDWNNIVDKNNLNYIMGNPPFVGHQLRNESQKKDMQIAFHDLFKHGKLDYVCAWYNKAADLMEDSKIKCAFVSTNSICQGESVDIMWDFLINKKNVEIQYAYKTFMWNSEAKEKAAVHCVIIGFTCYKINNKKYLFDNNNLKKVNHINGYLIDAPDIFITSRTKNKNEDIPPIIKGSQATDGGNLILSEEEANYLLKKYKNSDKIIKQYIGAIEFINNKKRYCIWLKDVEPSIYRNIPEIVERLNKVKEFRIKSPTESVKKASDTPMLFTQIRQPLSNYLIIPRVSSEKRRYIPIGYMNKDIICSDSNMLIASSSIYLFGILTSNVHMSWTRVVCGRLESRYRYSPAIYNNFPFPAANNEQK